MKKMMVWATPLLLFSMLAATPVRAAMGVFVTIAPQKWLAEKVGGNLIDVHVLVPAGQEPHDFQPTPRQVSALAKARLWFTVDMVFENQLAARVRGTSARLRIVDTTGGIHKIPLAEGVEDEHGADRHAAAGDHENEELDPHVWLSCANLQVMAAQMASSLSDVDPAHRLTYHNNLTKVTDELGQLNQRIATRLAPFAGASFLVFHPAFGYFADSYHLRQEAVEVGGKSPSPRRISFLIKKARQENVKVIFVQPEFDPKSAQVMAAAIGGRVVPLDPLAEDVPANLTKMAGKIAEALSK